MLDDKRILCLWFPLLATDRLTRPEGPLAAWRERPLVTAQEEQGGLRVAAANPPAREAGIHPGQPLADARALLPGLKSVPAEPDLDMRWLSALADWGRRYTPWTAIEGNEGLWLDVSGCAHLCGGEEKMLDDIAGRLDGFGFRVRAGLADTPGAAWAMARFGDQPRSIVPEGAGRQWLSGLPIQALRLPRQTIETLRRLGIRRLSDLLALPRGPLAQRFGGDVALRLDQMLGRMPEPISPRRPVARYRARLAFAEPIGRTEDVAAALRHLLERLCDLLDKEGMGARRLALDLHRVDGTIVRQEIGTAGPVRDPGHLERLFRDRLNGLDAGFGIEIMILEAVSHEALSAQQTALEAQARGHALPLLVDQLRQRLGEDRVFRFAPRERHHPEAALDRAPPLGRAPPPWPRRPPRPLRLLQPPERIEAEAEDPLGTPLAFSWRRDRHAVTRAEGPERIAVEWWHRATPPPSEAIRDYWRIEDALGRRFWLFRDGDGAWHLHGFFG
jgi:protein ImuB